MERDYSTGISESAIFFTGDEIEHTPAFGMPTLFVVGLQDVDQILLHCASERINHVYLGANHSYKPITYSDVAGWDALAAELLQSDLWVTLDLDSRYVEISADLLSMLSEFDRFIPMISVKIPYIQNLNYNACLKIDDKDFRASNPGVWVHYLHDLKDRKVFNDWSKYGNDVIVDNNVTEAKETGNE
jgi:hypothetical protein